MNKSGNQNRSVRNTKKRLKEALLILLQKKPVNEISVTELSELADVNRGTFYFHYTDVYDILYRTQDEFFREFEEILDFDENSKTNIYRDLLKIFSFLADNHDMCRVFFSENNDIMKRWLDDGLKETSEEIASLVSSIISSILNTNHCLL